MFQLIKDFPQQLLAAIEIGEKIDLQARFEGPIKNILVSGLGGSGIGGDLLSELLRNDLNIPVIVNKGYHLPAFVDASTLLILCSYSGNTEETVTCAKQAIKKGLTPVCITSGGKLEELATRHELDIINIPPGFPPRACLGYSVTQLFFILKHFGLVDVEFVSTLIRVASFLELEQEKIMADAEFLAGKIMRKVVIVYSEDKYESTAIRLKQQINENGKMHCWHNVVPELNHNELVGWRDKHPELAVLIFRTSDEYERNSHRIEFTKEVVEEKLENVFEIEAKGSDSFEKHFYLIHFGDWLSYHLALLQGYDPTEIIVLNKLKAHMSSISE
ncbi:MAG: manA [Bacteroidota bacterium]|nr:manA [Bacteroidota bacterium]